ncbi:MAG: hypothetical protein ABJB05_17465 [Parafilimonas sp.]
MKKIFTSILFVLYLAASSGATINFHYCMGKFIGLDVDAFSDNTCSNCGMAKEKKKGCCNEKHTTLQLKKDQLASNINEVPINDFVFIQHQYSFIIHSLNDVEKDAAQSIHSPPLIQPISACIFNCVFRI